MVSLHPKEVGRGSGSNEVSSETERERASRKARTHSFDSSHWRSWTTPASLVRISPCESDRYACFFSLSNATIRYSICKHVAGMSAEGA